MDMFHSRLTLGSNQKIIWGLQDPVFYRAVAITQVDGSAGPQTLAVDRDTAEMIVAFLREQFHLEV